MLTILQARDLLMKPPSRTIKFEGEPLDGIHVRGRMVTDWLDGKGWT
jgi:hypothetical protein